MKSVYCAVRTGSLNKTVCASSLKVNISQSCQYRNRKFLLNISRLSLKVHGVTSQKTNLYTCNHANVKNHKTLSNYAYIYTYILYSVYNTYFEFSPKGYAVVQSGRSYRRFGRTVCLHIQIFCNWRHKYSICGTIVTLRHTMPYQLHKLVLLSI